jgi:hypothetical protein
MGYKSDIHKAITKNTRYIADKVYNPVHECNIAGQHWLTIEIEVHKKKKSKTHRDAK